MSTKAGFNTKDLLMLGLIASGLYFLYKAFKVGQQALEPASNAIANTWLDLMLPGDVNVSADIVLPNGIGVSANDIVLNDDMTFSYGGVRYKLTSRNANNQYVAVYL